MLDKKQDPEDPKTDIQNKLLAARLGNPLPIKLGASGGNLLEAAIIVALDQKNENGLNYGNGNNLDDGDGHGNGWWDNYGDSLGNGWGAGDGGPIGDGYNRNHYKFNWGYGDGFYGAM